MKKLLLLALFCLAFSRLCIAASPNIVLVLSDDHSYPYLGCYGYDQLKTPNFDRFAREGMMFRRAFTTAPQCVPSRASIMTGRSPVAARMTRFSSPLPRDEITFPEILKSSGYYVGVLGRSYHLDGSGAQPKASEDVFAAHKLKTFKDRFDYVDSSAQQNVPKRIEEFFDGRPKDKPFFLWVNYSDPHHPWNSGQNPPDPAKLKLPGYWPDLPGLRSDFSKHLGEIEHCDGDFQTTLDILQKRAGETDFNNTLILFMGDNGMALPRGKGSLHEAGCNVPLLARWPGVIKNGGDSSALISGEDIAPTCLEAAGLPVPSRMSGVSFLPLLKGEKFEGRKYLFAERGPHGSATFTDKSSSNGIDYSRMVRSATHKLIYNVTPNLRYAPVDSGGDAGWQEMTRLHNEGKLAQPFEQIYFGPRPVYEFYDLVSDPNELKNLAGKPEVATIENELKVALQQKMILDFDYLPLPIPRDAEAGNNNNDRAKAFAKLDTNKDGKLSRDEFSANRKPEDAAMWFKARDVNNDNFISRDEYLSNNVTRPAEAN